MRLGFGRRLVPLSTLAIGCVAVGLILAIALFAFSTYVGHVRRDASALAASAAKAVDSMSPVDAIRAGNALASSFDYPALELVFVDGESRVTIVRDRTSATSTAAREIIRPRADLTGAGQPQGSLASLTIGLATIFGLQTVRTRAGQIDISAQVNPEVFVADIATFVPAFIAAMIVAIALALIAAAILTREALRPLSDVTRALQRFSDGDFTPEFISAEQDRQLGALALAYNGAVRQVEQAFAERARASASMRQFIADAGHQFRTPLTVMRGFIAILTKELDSADAERAHILKSMAKQVALMSTLVDKLVLLERWENEHPNLTASPVNIRELLKEIINPLALASPDRDISLIMDSDEAVFIAAADFNHAFSNVLDNAVKYTKGSITITVTTTPQEVEIVVADCGPGMTSEQRSRAFDRFYRGARRDVEGSGLGLAIARRAIERAGGTISIESRVDAGTQLAFTIPRCTQFAGATVTVTVTESGRR